MFFSSQDFSSIPRCYESFLTKTVKLSKNKICFFQVSLILPMARFAWTKTSAPLITCVSMEDVSTRKELSGAKSSLSKSPKVSINMEKALGAIQIIRDTLGGREGGSKNVT